MAKVAWLVCKPLCVSVNANALLLLLYSYCCCCVWRNAHLSMHIVFECIKALPKQRYNIIYITTFGNKGCQNESDTIDNDASWSEMKQAIYCENMLM